MRLVGKELPEFHSPGNLVPTKSLEVINCRRPVSPEVILSLFSFLKNARRKRLLAKYPLAEDLWRLALEEHPILHGLSSLEQNRLKELATLFLAEKEFFFSAGSEVSDAMTLSIAVQACLPILNLGINWYDDWNTIILTPEGYKIRKREVDEAGVVREFDDEVGGEVLELGPVVFSLRDVEDSGWGDGYNVVIHEMAHKLDGRTGAIDGCPPLPGGMNPFVWKKSFSDAFEKFKISLDRPGKSSLLKRIDSYAAEHPSEFFAVSCEYFFERPHLLSGAFPDVYNLLEGFFLQDPAARKRRGGLGKRYPKS